MAPWTDADDRKLLLTLIDLKGKKDWARSAELMGPAFSAEACRQHFRKFKDEIDQIVAAAESQKTDNTNSASAPATETPNKGRKRKAEATPSVAPKKRGRRAAASKVKAEQNSDEEST
ncbi:predicted protein [Paecilomyces variotii No. 5]|uniref:Myb-like domain-containing protein n=1 Tax=Byssochlamys spectabilis (strain No. 5 / NBRC 109023) TaxID=1356009 RepID=V5I3Y6_BYSSN|nr:predicted protein [Paecilomyces variotii No. 5]